MVQNMPGEEADPSPALPGFDARVPNPARMWNYWVGGKDHFPADREAAAKVQEAMPTLPVIAQMGRRFLISVVHTLAADYGIRQFLDIGTGLPTADNTHDVAQRVAPESRVVYVDHDPVVISHARTLLTSSPEGKTDFLQADVRDTRTILTHAAQTLDFARPVAVLLIAVLHFVPDTDDPYAAVGRLMDAVPPGSFLVIGHAASDIAAEAAQEMARQYNARSPVPISLRDRAQVTRFFEGLDLIDPGVVPLNHWPAFRQADIGDAAGLIGYSGMARKP